MKRVLVSSVALVALATVSPEARADQVRSWGVSVTAGAIEGLSFRESLTVGLAEATEHQQVDFADSAYLVTLDGTFNRRAGITLEYLSGGGASLAQSIVVPAYNVSPFEDRDATVRDLTLTVPRYDLPVDLEFVSAGVAFHLVQGSRVQISPRILVSRALGLPDASDLRLVGADALANVALNNIPVTDELVAANHDNLEVDIPSDLALGVGLDVGIKLHWGWKRWQGRRGFSLIVTARYFDFGAIQATAEETNVINEGGGLTLNPGTRFELPLDLTYLGAGLRFTF